MRYILASTSPRRRELITLLGLPFESAAADVDEARLPGERPDDYARRLSEHKAMTAASRITGEALILAADTVVVDGDEALGKPRSPAEARAMLWQLRGRVHHAYTAVSLLETSSGRVLTALADSPVWMRAYSDAEIEAYLASGDPFDKAGAYAIQHEGFHPAEAFDHCMANVMGLPLCHISRLLKQMGIGLPVDTPAVCQPAIGYSCPVYERILNGHD